MNNTEWLAQQGKVCSVFGSQVAEIVGTVYKGLYHIPETATHKRTEWDSEHWIEITVRDTLSTFDDSNLTQLVILCHDAAIRLEIKASSTNYLKLCFSPRQHHAKSSWIKHPTMEDAIKKIRSQND
jgi:hypothetical protein